MLKSLDGSIIAILILIIILAQIYDRSRNIFMQYRIFIFMVFTNIALLVVDLFTWYFDGKTGLLNHAGAITANIIVYSLQPLPASLFTVYIYDFFSYDWNKRYKVMKTAFALLAVNAVLSAISAYTGWFYDIDTDNIYHRGSLFYVHEALCLVFYVYSVFIIIKDRKAVHTRNFLALLAFFIPVTTGIVIQNLFYGYSAIFIGISISLLIIYINIQARSLKTDYLTGVNNRRCLDEYLSAKINNCINLSFKSIIPFETVRPGTVFAAIMIDIDEFKLINDNFGHDVGDQALKDAVCIIKSSLKRDDFIARIGGDEFVIIIDVDVKNPQQSLENAVNKIKENTDNFNSQNIRPYLLRFSIGKSLYDGRSRMQAGELLNRIDRLMYSDKKR